MTTESSDTRNLIREAIKKLPLDNIALRKFYEAFLFRRGVSSTNEGGAKDETRALQYALSRALVRGQISGVGFLSESGVPEVVEQTFVDKLVSALDVSGSFLKRELELFASLSKVVIVEGVVDALAAYAFYSRNALDYYH